MQNLASCLIINLCLQSFFSFNIDPPTELVISGYHSGTYVDAGTVQRLICKSSGGNPLATLTWFKNDRKV